MSVKTIGILGAGTMGQGIAQVASESGFEVRIKDANEEVTQTGVANSDKNWGRLNE